MAVNIPIRLVRKGGDLIPLDVTTLTLDVDRGVNPHTTPLGGGKRWAFDFNMAKAVILLEGIIADDELTSQTTDLGQKSTATLDFSRTSAVNNNGNLLLDSLVSQWEITANDLTNNDFDNYKIPRMNLKSESNDVVEIYFIKSDTTYGYDLGSSGKYHVSIVEAGGTMRTAAEIAGYLTDLINSSLNSSYLSNRFTALRVNSNITNNTNEAVDITQVTAGNNSNGVTPSWVGYSTTPHTTLFTGGEPSSSAFTSMSAGDKVMLLYGTLNNSNDGGITAISKGHLKSKRDTLGHGLAGISQQDLKYGDYIIGIQIPFNSTIDNDAGDKYIAKNFFMPTGGMENVVTKHPRQAQLASSVISNPNDNDETTFIKGAVTKATFVQIGGEPIYQFNIQFVPVDSIL
jgi:hypothetical protein